jgi:hypothetical protein
VGGRRGVSRRCTVTILYNKTLLAHVSQKCHVKMVTVSTLIFHRYSRTYMTSSSNACVSRRGIIFKMIDLRIVGFCKPSMYGQIGNALILKELRRRTRFYINE